MVPQWAQVGSRLAAPVVSPIAKQQLLMMYRSVMASAEKYIRMGQMLLAAVQKEMANWTVWWR